MKIDDLCASKYLYVITCYRDILQVKTAEESFQDGSNFWESDRPVDFRRQIFEKNIMLKFIFH